MLLNPLPCVTLYNSKVLRNYRKGSVGQLPAHMVAFHDAI